MAALRIGGEVTPPGDKSISHRALMLAAVTRGKSRISGILDSADVLSTAGVLRSLGADIPPLGSEVIVTGRPARFLASPHEPLDCGNSGTTARLMAGVVAGAGLTAIFAGDESLSRRPMRRIAEPLRAMGAHVTLNPGDRLPMGVAGGALKPIHWQSPVASAQVKSAILLAAVLGGVEASVAEPHRSRDHTERMLRARGVDVEVDGAWARVEAAQILRPLDTTVPADPSSAAFFVALAVLADAGEIVVRNVCLNDTRTGFFRVLMRMGAQIEVRDARDTGGEPVGDLVARPSSLRGVEISAAEVPSLIDELPLFACIASRADGESVVQGAGELRVKESDRLQLIVENLRRVGAAAEERDDGFVIGGSATGLRGNVVTGRDHRIAMSFGVLGALPGNDLGIDERGCVEVSFPGFWTELQRLTA